MTLKEKLEVEIMDLPIVSEVVEDIAKNLEYVAEDFAIGFAKWFALHHTEEVFYEDNYTEEMLEKYKKEKGL